MSKQGFLVWHKHDDYVHKKFDDEDTDYSLYCIGDGWILERVSLQDVRDWFTDQYQDDEYFDYKDGG